MIIHAVNTDYLIKRDTLQWTLSTPTVGVNVRTKAEVAGFRDTYHKTLGQALAAISEKELGKAENVDQLAELCMTLRNDLLNHE